MSGMTGAGSVGLCVSMADRWGRIDGTADGWGRA